VRFYQGGPANGIVCGSQGAPRRRRVDDSPDGIDNASKSAVTKTAKTTAVNNTGPTIFGKTITAAGVPISDQRR